MQLHDKPNTCPLCGETAETNELNNGTVITKCRTCGNYRISDFFHSYTGISDDAVIQRIRGGDPDPEDIDVPLYELQAIIHEKNNDEIEPYIGWALDERWLTLKQLVASVKIPKTPLQKIDKLLENLAKVSHHNFGATLTIGAETHKKLAYAKTASEFGFLMKNAIRLDLIDDVGSMDQAYRISISLRGWQRIEEIQETNKDSKQGFVAHWFGLDLTLVEAMEEGVRAAGFEPLSLKGKHYPETVLSKAFGEINRSRFVVVDLTEQRSSVFMEAGYTLGRGIQTILVINREYWDKNKKELEFYVTNYNIKQYSSAEELKEIVETAIRERIL